MKELTIRLRCFEDVQELCRMSEQVPFQANLSDGRRCVNLSSMMQIFSLDLCEELLLQMDCSEESFQAVCKKLERLEVK